MELEKAPWQARTEELPRSSPKGNRSGEALAHSNLQTTSLVTPAPAGLVFGILEHVLVDWVLCIAVVVDER